MLETVEQASRTNTLHTAQCREDEYAISGSCGDQGGANDVIVMYSGPNPTNFRSWTCYIINPHLTQSRTITLGAYCAPWPDPIFEDENAQ